MSSSSGETFRSYSTIKRDKTSRVAEADPLLPGYSASAAPSANCCRCEYYSFLGTASVAASLFGIFALFLLPGIITAWRTSLSTPDIPLNPAPIQTIPSNTPTNAPTPVVPPPPPPPPPPHIDPPQPFEKAGLSGIDVPLPGAVYIITEGNSTRALTYDGNEGVTMAEYQRGYTRTQRWSCHESEGWIGFTIDPGQSTVFLGYSAWPSSPVLRCSARAQQFNEMFVISKMPEHGFRMIMRDGGGLKPVGRNSGGALAMVRDSDIWWRFTKV